MPSMTLRSPNLADGEVPFVVRIYERSPPTAFRNGGLAMAANHVRDAGRGGDEVLLHINPHEYEFLKRAWGEPSVNPHTGLPEYGLFSKLKKALKFEAFNVKGIVKDIAKNPQRLLTGAVDPISTKLTNKVFGTHYKPAVNQLGGATEDRFREAEAKGMDTGTARTLHKVAGAIAGFYGGNALGNLASTGLGNVAQGLQTTANANTLSPAITTAKYTGDYISPVLTSGQQAALTQAGQAAANAAVDSNLTGTLAQFGANAATKGAGALSNVGDKAIDYAKDPKNWATIAKVVGAAGALAGAGGGSQDQGAPPNTQPSSGTQLPNATFERSRNDMPFDWYTYGERPEERFYSDNVAPTIPSATPAPTVPDDKHAWMGAVPGGASGGRFGGAGSSGSFGPATKNRYVRGAGTGRSDSIDAKLSNGEYVLTAEDVALLGDGSSDAGARRLDDFRKNLRKHKGGALAKGKISPNAKPPMAYLRGKR